MKKGVILAICGILFLCAIVSAGGAGGWYFLVRSSPEKSFSMAVDSMQAGDYYQFDSESKLTMEMEIPDYPEFSMDISMTMTQEGKADIQNDKMYMKTTTTTEGISETIEVYIIGNDIYTKIGSGEFTKTTEDAGDQTAFDTFNDYDENTAYTILEAEDVDGLSAYKYEIAVNDDDLGSFVDNFTDALGEAEGVTVADVTVEGAKQVVWVSKSDGKVVKTYMTIDKITASGTTEGIDYNMVMSDVEITANYSGWGEKVDIEAPV